MRWWPWRRATALPHWNVVMYTRSGCHLCEDAWEFLARAREEHGFALSRVDVDTDEGLVAEFGDHVPVVEINGKVRFRGHISPVLFDRLVKGDRQKKRGTAATQKTQREERREDQEETNK